MHRHANQCTDVRLCISIYTWLVGCKNVFTHTKRCQQVMKRWVLMQPPFWCQFCLLDVVGLGHCLDVLVVSRSIAIFLCWFPVVTFFSCLLDFVVFCLPRPLTCLWLRICTAGLWTLIRLTMILLEPLIPCSGPVSPATHHFTGPCPLSRWVLCCVRCLWVAFYKSAAPSSLDPTGKTGTLLYKRTFQFRLSFI